jgi:hypothetical protein
VIMGAVVWAVARALIPVEAIAFSRLLAGLVGCLIVGVVVFGICCYLVRSPEFISGIVEVRTRLKNVAKSSGQGAEW